MTDRVQSDLNPSGLTQSDTWPIFTKFDQWSLTKHLSMSSESCDSVIRVDANFALHLSHQKLAKNNYLKIFNLLFWML